MQWSEGDQWLLSLDLPAGSHEFKLVTVAPPAREGACPYADWEAGANRTLKVSAAACISGVREGWRELQATLGLGVAGVE